MTARARMKRWLERRWYSRQAPPWFLRPPAVLFGLVVRLRRYGQQRRAARGLLALPVIVVGNIAVGGTGKTPFVIWLVQHLREWGWKPGVISRGYGGNSRTWPRQVRADSNPAEVGDEPVLIASRAACPVVVGPDRLQAAQALMRRGDVDVIVSDDGLQHYRLWRSLEFAVVDGHRGLGNGRLLPAGPLREPARRLQEVGLVVVNGSGWTPTGIRKAGLRLYATEVRTLADGVSRPITDFAGHTVHAVAGIGNPARFFSMLSRHNIRLVVHPFPDHHPFRSADLEFGDGLPVLMTEKDAVKCRTFARENHWVVPVEAVLSPDDTAFVQELARTLKAKTVHG